MCVLVITQFFPVPVRKPRGEDWKTRRRHLTTRRGKSCIDSGHCSIYTVHFIQNQQFILSSIFEPFWREERTLFWSFGPDISNFTVNLLYDLLILGKILVSICFYIAKLHCDLTVSMGVGDRFILHVELSQCEGVYLSFTISIMSSFYLSV